MSGKPSGKNGEALPARIEETTDAPQRETSAVAAAETARAIVQARYTVAINRPRKIEDARVRLLAACRRPSFAAVARYRKPTGGTTVDGPSIRFADEAAKIFGNIDVTEDVVFEDEERRIVRVTATDLETNLSKAKSVTIPKTIERRAPKRGQEVLASRQNSQGQTVYVVRANDDEMAIKESAVCAKVRRNLELQLIPQDIIDECEEAVIATLTAADAHDPESARRRILDAFASVGVKPSALEGYIGEPIESLGVEGIRALREVYLAIKEGEATWSEFAAAGTDETGEGARARAFRERLRAARQSVQETTVTEREPGEDDE